MGNLFLNKIYIKFISVLFAIILWLSVSISKKFKLTLEIPIDIINIDTTQYVLIGNVPKTTKVDFYGIGKKLIKIYFSNKLNFTIDLKNTPINKKYLIHLNKDILNGPEDIQNVGILKISPDTIPIYLTKKSTKKIKIKSNVNIKTNKNYKIKDINFTPDYTFIEGPEYIVKNITYVETETLNILNLDDDTKYKIKLIAPQGTKINPKYTNLIVTLEKIDIRSFYNIPINLEISNKLKIKGSYLETDILKCNIDISGPAGIIDSINSNDFKISCFINKEIKDTILLPVHVTLSKYNNVIEIIDYTPKKIKIWKSIKK